MKPWKTSLLVLTPVILVVLLLLLSIVNKPQSFHVGVLTLSEQRNEKTDGLIKTLKQLRYVKGENISYKILNAENDTNKLPELARELLQDDLDVIIATGGLDAMILKDISAEMRISTPIVFMGTLSPVDFGLVRDLSHPGGNLTGLANTHVELTTKRLELLHSLLPHIQSVALFEDTRSTLYVDAANKIYETAEALNISVHSYHISSENEISPVMDQIIADGNEAILLLPGFFIEISIDRIIEEANYKKLPIFGIYPSDAVKGCIAAYGTSYYEQGSQCAYLVQKLLRGQTPSEIPIETPDALHFIVNKGAAERLNLKLNPSAFSFSEKVIP